MDPVTDNSIETTLPKDDLNAKPAADDLLAQIRTILDDHMAEDIVAIDLAGKSTIADYMLIASGRSSRQVIAMAEFVAAHLKEVGVGSVRPEGIGQGDWVLIDAGDVIVHLFRPEVREFYGLEKMWEASLPEIGRAHV